MKKCILNCHLSFPPSHLSGGLLPPGEMFTPFFCSQSPCPDWKKCAAFGSKIWGSVLPLSATTSTTAIQNFSSQNALHFETYFLPRQYASQRQAIMQDAQRQQRQAVPQGEASLTLTSPGTPPLRQHLGYMPYSPTPYYC